MALSGKVIEMSFPLGALQNALEALNPDFRRWPYSAVFNNAKLRTIRGAQERVPVGLHVSPTSQRAIRGGGLKAAITGYTRLTHNEAVVTVGVMGADAPSHPYAAIVELGGAVPARSPVRKRWMRYVEYGKGTLVGLKNSKSRKKIAGDVRFAKRVGGFYLRPRPYLRPAMLDAGDAAMNELGKALADQWQKKLDRKKN